MIFWKIWGIYLEGIVEFCIFVVSLVTNRVIFPRGQGLNQYYPLAVIRRLFLFSIYPDKKLDKVFGNVISLNRYFPFSFKDNHFSSPWIFKIMPNGFSESPGIVIGRHVENCPVCLACAWAQSRTDGVLSHHCFKICQVLNASLSVPFTAWVLKIFGKIFGGYWGFLYFCDVGVIWRKTTENRIRTCKTEEAMDFIHGLPWF